MVHVARVWDCGALWRPRCGQAAAGRDVALPLRSRLICAYALCAALLPRSIPHLTPFFLQRDAFSNQSCRGVSHGAQPADDSHDSGVCYTRVIAGYSPTPWSRCRAAATKIESKKKEGLN